MGRPRQFDPDMALDAAQAAFWSHGYEATSMAELCDATGMLRGSLYQAFGDKHALYMTVLERYLTHGLAKLEAALAADAPAPARVEAWLRAVSAGACPLQSPGGCMALNALVELGPHDDVVRARLERHFEAIGARLEAVLVAGQAEGTVRTDQPAAALAACLQTFVAGLMASFRSGPLTGLNGLFGLAMEVIRPGGAGAAVQALGLDSP